MSTRPLPAIEPGWSVYGAEGQLVGRVDAAFADYLLVRTSGIVPVDLYIPIDAVAGSAGGRVALRERADGAYERWHRPLKRAPHA